MTVAQKRVFWFFIATFAFAWIGNLGNWIWPSSAWPVPLNPVGPALAALVVIALMDGREGLRRWWAVLAKFRAPGWVYAVAVLLPLAVHLVSIWLGTLSGVALGPLPEREWFQFLTLVPVLLLAGPLFEETAFVGHAQVELERDLSPLAAALIIGVGCVVWHLPMFVRFPLEGALAGVVFLVAATVFYVWLYEVSGSVWPAVIAHLSLNYFGTHYLSRMITERSDLFLTYGYVAGCFTLLALGLVWRHGWRLGQRPVAAAGPGMTGARA